MALFTFHCSVGSAAAAHRAIEIDAALTCCGCNPSLVQHVTRCVCVSCLHRRRLLLQTLGSWEQQVVKYGQSSLGSLEERLATIGRHNVQARERPPLWVCNLVCSCRFEDPA
jgi:hypothetical protein